MKKSFLPITLAALLMLVGCNGGGTTSSSVTPSTPSSSTPSTPTSEEPKYTALSISNKSDLQAAWSVGHASRTLQLSVSPTANISSLISQKKLVVSSSNDKIVSVSGLIANPVGIGEATITVTLGTLTDSFKVTVAKSVASINVGSPCVGIGYTYPVSFESEDVLSTYLNAKWTLTKSEDVKATISAETGSSVNLAIASDSGTGTVKLEAVSSTYDTIKTEVTLPVLTPSTPSSGYYSGNINVAALPKKAAKADSEVFYSLAADTAEACYKKPSVIFDKSIINSPYGGVDEMAITQGKVIKSGASSGNILSVTFDLYKYNNMVVFNEKAPVDDEDERVPLKAKSVTDGSHIYATYTLNSEYFEAFSSYDGKSYVYGMYLNYKIGENIQAPTEIKVTGEDTIFMKDSTTYTIDIDPSFADPSVSWKSSDTTVATVDKTGKVTGIKVGKATITATSTVSGSTVSGTKEITIAAIETKTVAETRALAAEQIINLDAVVLAKTSKGAIVADAGGMIYVRSSKMGSPKVGDYMTFTGHTSSYNGVRQLGSDTTAVANTGDKPTVALPTASELTAATFDTFDSNSSDSADAGKIAFIKGQVKVSKAGTTFYFKAEGDTDFSKQVGYISDSVYVKNGYNQFAVEGNEGLVLNITGIVADNKLDYGDFIGQDVIVLTAEPVEKDVAPLTMSVAGPDELLVGDTYKLSCDVTPISTAIKTVTWSTKDNDETVATVAADGTVTAVAAGKVEVIATSTKDATKTASFIIRVVDSYTKLTLDSDSLGLGSSYNKTPTDATLKGVGLSYLVVGDFGDGIQMKASSTIYNTSATDKGIKKITFNVTEGKIATQTNRSFIVAFGKKDSNCADLMKTVTCEDGTESYVVSTGDYSSTYKYFKIIYTGENTGYFSSIVVKYNA